MESGSVSPLLSLVKYYLSLRIRLRHPLLTKAFPPGWFRCLLLLFPFNFVSSSSYIIHYNLPDLSPAPLTFLVGTERELHSPGTQTLDCIQEYLSLRGKCTLRTLKPSITLGLLILFIVCKQTPQFQRNHKTDNIISIFFQVLKLVTATLAVLI